MKNSASAKSLGDVCSWPFTPCGPETIGPLRGIADVTGFLPTCAGRSLTPSASSAFRWDDEYRQPAANRWKRFQWRLPLGHTGFLQPLN